MAYVIDANLTSEYIATLISRVGFTDVTSSYPPDIYGEVLAIQDLNGNINFFSNLGSVRDFLILAYVIQQNS